MPLIEIYPDRESWLDGRRNSIGGSDAYAAAFEPFGLWCEKTGKVNAGPPAGLEFRFKVGHALEPVIHELASNSLPLWDPGDFTIFRSRDYPATATADRLWMPEPVSSYPKHRVTLSGVRRMYKLATGPAEFKTVSEFAVDSSPPYADWTEEEPATYALMQMQHTLSVMDKPKGVIIALVGFSKLWLYVIEANPVLQAALRRAEERFWDCVVSDTQPDIHESEASAAALAALFPQDDGTEIELEEEMAWPWFERLEEARAARKVAEAEAKLAEVPIKEALGASTSAIIGEKGEFTWKTTKAGSRPLRLKRKRGIE